MSCLFRPNDTISQGYTYSFFAQSVAEAITCPINYLRPDPGGALLPWLYTLFLLCFHLPASVLRVLRWESAQYFALTLALFTVALCIQSYTSTGLAANQVLVWMPLTLLQDVGAMVQMVVLIIERDEPHGGAHGLAREIGMLLLRTWRVIASGGRRRTKRVPDLPLHEIPQQIPPVEAADAGIHPALPLSIPQHAAGQEGHGSAEADMAHPRNELLLHALTCLAALALLLALLVLQIYGIYAAARGLGEATSTSPKDAAASTVKWCSPGFRDFAVAISTGNCEIYEVTDAISNGIGCVSLPAREQRSWLKATIGALAVSLVIEVADMIIIKLARGKRVRGVDMDRPWLTMISGILMLVILLAFGIFDASRLPPGITDTVWVYRAAPSASSGTVCRQSLTAPGLRGMIIGYTDGLLGGWSEVYYGYNAAIARVRRWIVRRF